MEQMVVAAGLGDILEKIKGGERLSVADGVRLYKTCLLYTSPSPRD